MELAADTVWQNVFTDTAFDWPWPALPGPEGTPLSTTIVRVTADVWPDVTYDLTGVRGAYRGSILFAPAIALADHERFPPHGFSYLYSYAAAAAQWRLVPYTCTYRVPRDPDYPDNPLLMIEVPYTWSVRVWNTYTNARAWIVARVAAEVARDADPNNPALYLEEDH